MFSHLLSIAVLILIVGAIAEDIDQGQLQDIRNAENLVDGVGRETSEIDSARNNYTSKVIAKNQRASNGCPHGFTFLPGTNKCYILVYFKYNWAEARRNCKGFNRKSRLLMIHDKREQDSIVSFFLHPRKEIIEKDCRLFSNGINFIAIWTAGQRVTTDPPSRNWVWKPDVWHEMGFTGWNSGEPNNMHNKESCMHLNHMTFGWNDESCESKSCSICEIDLN